MGKLFAFCAALLFLCVDAQSLTMKAVSHGPNTTNASLELAIWNPPGGYVRVITDSNGHFKLDDKFKNIKISCSLLNTGMCPWVVAAEGATSEVYPSPPPPDPDRRKK